MQLGKFVEDIEDELTRQGLATIFCSARTERMRRAGDASLSNADGIRFFEPSLPKSSGLFFSAAAIRRLAS